MVKLSTLVDSFTTPSINTALWDNITGTATLDTVNDLVTLAQPTTSGATNSFGSSTLWDATSSQIYAQIGTVPTGAGTTSTAMVLRLDTNNSVAIRLEASVFKLTLQTAGSTVATTLPAYSPDAHRWWRIREAAGSWYADTSADGITWTTLATTTYTWSATGLTFAFQTAAGGTEVAGLIASIENINTPLGGPQNPNWPLIEHGWGARWTCNGGNSPHDQYTDVSLRTRGSTSMSRGRQYELDQIRSAEATVQLANTDSALDPTNTTGPFYGHIQPYQPYRIRAQWPATRNLLSQFQATGGDLGGYTLGTIDQGNTGPSTYCSTAGAGTFATVASASAWQGGTVIQAPVASGTVAASGTTTPGLICWTPRPSAQPGETYTMQIRARNVTAGTSQQVAAFIYGATAASVGTANVGSTVTLTGSPTANWTTLTVTATLGPDAAYTVCGIRTAATAAATCNIQVDGWQMEHGPTASAWTCPGTSYPMYGGFVERWSPAWAMSGTYGTIAPTCVDAFSLLSQVQLTDPLTQEITNRNPRFLYKLDDPQGSTTATDATGNYAAAPLANSKYGAGSWAFGSTITAANTTTGLYTGSGGTVATINNPSPGVASLTPSTFLQLDQAGIKGPANPTGDWTRMLAFRYTGPTPTYAAFLWSCMDRQHANGQSDGSQLYFVVGTSGKFAVWMAGPSGFLTAYETSVSVVDSNWHLAIASYTHATGTLSVTVDAPTTYWAGISSSEPTGLISDCLGAYVDVTSGGWSIGNFRGDLSYAAEFPTALSIADAGTIYTAWRNSCAGESTDARYARILRYSGYTGPSSIQTGLTTSMGPAAFEGQDIVTALQAVVDTENGEHFVDRAGTVTFRSRSARYNALNPVLILGERADLGEWPYEDCQLDYDSTHLSNQVTVTQASTGQTFYQQDAASIASYFPRTLTRTINASSGLECQDAAGYLLSRYKQPAVRVPSVKLHPSAQPALWPVLLNLELGTRARVMRRPPGVPAVAVDCYIESIAWELGDDGDAWATLQCSPADINPYASFAAWHTTLKTSVASGVTSITVNASADTTNPLATQLAAGQQIVLGQGSANQETVTVASVGGTVPGWTQATIALTAATTKVHTSGDTICEPLPAGTTDPTTWDAVDQFDDCTFAY
ncbi:hypothetical protein OIU81_02785 [Streptomyces sp. NBC_01454]|uniref:hypothetical protein n=1 Tax=Streptomyces sp. NBC_01454 TaxID=2975867 RepID=UPI002E2F209A|nr:hypothetical protein [Streptomyces sp. NBC_01454]